MKNKIMKVIAKFEKRISYAKRMQKKYSSKRHWVSEELWIVEKQAYEKCLQECKKLISK